MPSRAVMKTRTSKAALNSGNAAQYTIQQARESALNYMNLDPDNVLTAQERAQLDFFTIQCLIMHAQVLKSATVRFCEEVYLSENYKALGYETWDLYVEAIASTDGTTQLEISPELLSYLRALVPGLYAFLHVSPIEIFEELKPGEDEPRLKEVITDETFLDGKLGQAFELSPLLRHHDPLDPTFKPVFEKWVIEAAHSSRLDLRKKMQAAGMKGIRGDSQEKISALRSLETSYVDPESGEIIDGEVTIITLYLRSRYQEKLFNARLGDFIQETMRANPEKATA